MQPTSEVPPSGATVLDAPPPAPAPPATTTPMAPVAARERIAEIDVVRGFALFGILLMNIEFFTRPMSGMFFGLDATLEGVDRAAGWLVMTFVQGKFYTLFSMLFGMGFAIQALRAQQRGRKFGRLFLRRMLGLALIGAAHGYLLWSGDILLVYSIVGAVMVLLFRKTPVSRLWKWAIAFILLVVLAQIGWIASIQGSPEGAANAERMMSGLRQEYGEASELYATASWTDLFPQRVHEMGQQLSYLPVFGFDVLGMFLLGAWLVRSGAMSDPAAHRATFRRFLIAGLVVGAPLAVVAMELGVADGMAEMSWAAAAAGALMLIASFALCFGYLGGFVLWAQSPAWRPRLAPVAAAGRMALTNYLLQSLVATTLFYGYGFGLFGQVGRAAQLALALAIWLGNLAFSAWWLARFRFGPAEWLWRSFTYGYRQPMRREAAES